MQTCPHCQADIDPGDQFCGSLGSDCQHPEVQVLQVRWRNPKRILRCCQNRRGAWTGC